MSNDRSFTTADAYYRVSWQDSSSMGSWCFLIASPARRGRYGFVKAVKGPEAAAAAKLRTWTYAGEQAVKLADRYDATRDRDYTRVIITLHEPGKPSTEVLRATPGTPEWATLTGTAHAPTEPIC